MSGTRRIARVVIWVAMIVIGLMLVLDVLYYMRGSLEMLPTEDDHEKVRVVTTVVGVVLVLTEIVLWLLLRSLGTPETSPGRDGAA